MKKIVFILILFAIGALLCRAQLALNNAPFAALLSRNPATAGYFLQENFEGPGYQNTWNISGGLGTIDDQWTTAPAPLEASYSLLVNLLNPTAHTRSITNNLPSVYSTIYGFMQVNVITVGATTSPLITLLNSNQPVLAIELFENTANNFAVQLKDTNASYCCAQSVTADEGVTNYVWFSITTGTGLNASYEFAYSTNTTKPTGGANRITTSAGRAVGTMNQIQIGSTSSIPWRVIFDKIRLSTTPIGDNPP